jgi:hypothetical protein
MLGGLAWIVDPQPSAFGMHVEDLHRHVGQGEDLGRVELADVEGPIQEPAIIEEWVTQVP